MSKSISKNPDELPSVSSKFLDENQSFSKKLQDKKGGPYSKTDRYARRTEVYRLHFEFGYSANRIAEMMKINRNTINGDISYWFDKITKNWKLTDPEVLVVKNINRLELQRTRLREELEKTKVLQEKLSIEKMLFELDSKILQTNLKFIESEKRYNDLSIRRLNNWLKKRNSKERFLSLFDLYSVPSKSLDKIRKIINEDRKRPI